MQEKINEFFRSADADSLLLSTDGSNVNTNFYYFTEMSQKKQLSGYLILKKGNKPLLITDPREYGILKKYKNFKTALYRNEKELIALLDKSAGKKIGINYQEASIAGYKRIKKILKRRFVDVSGTLNILRSTKTNREIKKIHEACKISEELISKVAKSIKEGQSEKEIAKKLDLQALSNSEGSSFPTIVAIAGNSSTPHHIAGNKKLRKGDILLIDFGVVYDGYCSDLTRTFVFGRANVMQKHVYAIVYKAQRAAMAAIKEGAKASDVFHIANNIIKEAFGQELIHALGHGLGILVHDFPQGLHKKADYPLQSNMILTVEPGHYGPFGVRIEDDIVVTAKGCKLLSDAPQQLVEL